MDGKLKDLVINHWTHHNIEYNYVSLYSPTQKINLPNEKIESFILNYCELLYDSSPESPAQLNIAEKAHVDMPFHVKGEFRMSKPHDWMDNIITSICYCFQQSLLEYYNIDDKKRLTCAFLTASEPVKMVDYYQYKFMIYFPFCVTKASEQVGAIVIAENKLRDINVIGKFTQQPRNDWDSILNKNSANEDLVMYGSIKNPADKPLDDYRIFNILKSEDDTESEIELSDVFFPEKHVLFQKKIIKECELEGSPSIEYWLPLFFSCGFHSEITTRRPTREKQQKNIYSCAKDELHFVFLEMIPPKEYEHKHIYLDVGKVLYKIYKGNPIGLELWLRYAKIAPGNEAETESLYYSFGINNNLTVQTLAWYAKQTNPEEYNKWSDEVWWEPTLKTCATGTHSDVAECFYKKYWLDYVCSRAKKSIWYRYNGTRWELMDGDVFISQRISKEFVNEIQNSISKIDELSRKTNDELESKRHKELANSLRTVCNKLKTYTFKSQLKKELVDFFYREGFEDLLDENDNMLGLPSRILEFIDNTTYTIRAGKPEDFISRSTLVDYNNRYHHDHPHVKRCKHFLRQINTDPETYESYLNLLSSILKGGNGDKNFYIISGKKHNAKSQQKKLLELIFGPQYAVTVPPQALTAKRTNSSAPAPELAQAKRCRVMLTQEPDNDSNFADSFIKTTTGGDAQFVRALHENGTTMRATFKVILFCNDIPIFPYLDDAMRDRVFIYPMLSTWVENAPESEEEQFKARLFKMDPNFESKLPELAAPLLWLMVQNLPNYLNGKPRITKSALIKKVISEYWEETDIYHKFINSELQKCLTHDGKPDPTAVVSYSELQREFNSWFRDTLGLKLPKASTVKKEFISRLGEMRDGGDWIGWRFLA